MIEPVSFEQPDPCTAVIGWKDGMESRHRAVELRRECPCAGCVDEFTGKQILDPGSVPEDIQITNVEVVGRYALRFRFSDGHDTGLFTFAFLRDMAVREKEQGEA
jgi:DUF971 family protein